MRREITSPKRIERDEPLHLLIDSTGLKIHGEDELTAFRSFGQHAGANAVVPNQLQKVGPASAKRIHPTIERIFRQRSLHQHR
jgi:hypothetical protein